MHLVYGEKEKQLENGTFAKAAKQYIIVDVNVKNYHGIDMDIEINVKNYKN